MFACPYVMHLGDLHNVAMWHLIFVSCQVYPIYAYYMMFHVILTSYNFYMYACIVLFICDLGHVEKYIYSL